MGWMIQDLTPTRARDFSWMFRQALGPTQPLYSARDISFLELKWLGHGINHPPTSSTEVEERVEQYLCSSSGPSWSVKGRILPLLFNFTIPRLTSVSSTLYQKNVSGPFPQVK